MSLKKKIKANNALSETLNETTVEAAKQNSLDYTNTFISYLGENLVSGETEEYFAGLGEKISSGIGSGLNLEGLSTLGTGSDFIDISTLSEDLGVSNILGTSFLSDNTAIGDIQNGQNTMNTLLGQLLGKETQNGADMNTMMGYFKTLAGNSNATVDALSGMAVYLDKDAVVGVVSPEINNNLYKQYVGAMRGQYK